MTTYITKPLSSNYKLRSKNLFSRTFPAKSITSDFEPSWNCRNREESLAILDLNGSFIGFVIASYNRSTGESKYIDYIALDANVRGKGIGTNLLKNIVNSTLSDRGSVHLYPESPDRVSWYARNGFFPTYDGYYVCHSYSTRSHCSLDS